MKQFAGAALIMAVLFSVISQPAFARDETNICQSAKAHASVIVSKVPIEVDSATNTTGATADCDAKILTVSRKIELKHARMEDDFETFLRDQISQDACKDKTESDLLNSGWKVQYENTFADGPVVKIDLKCE